MQRTCVESITDSSLGSIGPTLEQVMAEEFDADAIQRINTLVDIQVTHVTGTQICTLLVDRR